MSPQGKIRLSGYLGRAMALNLRFPEQGNVGARACVVQMRRLWGKGVQDMTPDEYENYAYGFQRFDREFHKVLYAR